MATFQTQQEVKLPSTIETSDSDFLSLTMAALHIVNPWAKKWIEKTATNENEPKTRIITLSEVSCHDSPKDCWVIIYDRVYDITNFLDEHPGGADVMLEYAGNDASLSFRGTGHSKMAIKALDRYLVGELPIHERLYRKIGGIRLSDIPD